MGIVAPDIEALVSPEFAVTMPPVHVVDVAGDAATTMPLGKVSVKLALVIEAPVLFFNVTVSTDEAPALTDEGLKDFVIVVPSLMVTVFAVTATGLHTVGVVVLHIALLGAIGNELVYIRPEGVF